MKVFITRLLATALAMTSMGYAQADESPPATSGKKSVVIIPVRSGIDKPALYILRRGLKEAIEQEVDTIVLDMETPGGRLDVTFDILKALEKFPGQTITYINREAISAGALISAGTDDIWFAPQGVIGAAAPVMSSGGEIDSTMRSKIVSYLKARVRSISEGKGYRGEVISAMIDIDFEFKIGDEVIKKKGELLSLTAQEAMKEYGEPLHPLLGAGIADDINDLLNQVHGSGNYTVERLEASWSEELAQYLTALTPVLFAIGLLGLFVEFKTPGFGLFGVAGIVLLAIVFFGYNVAGLSGYEPALLFLLGILLICAEIFFFPGTIVLALSGIVMMLGALIWMMLDIWPNEPLDISGDLLFSPLANLAAGIVGAVVLFIALLKFLPSGGPWGNMILSTAVAGEPSGIHALNSSSRATPDQTDDLIGQTGIATTDMFPSGQIEIGGRRYEAKLTMGSADAGAKIKVVKASQFGLIVEVIS